LVYWSAWLTWILPMIGALMAPLFALGGRRLRDLGPVSFSFLGAVCAALLLPNALAGRTIHDEIPWIPSLGVKAGMLVDPLSVYLSNVVAWISFLIMVYSIGYMRGDETISRYWFWMNFFIGNMLLLVLSDNFLQLLIGWEGVGLCSYALIGYYYKDQEEWWVGVPGDRAMGVPMAYSPSHAGMKAFIMTRVGDIGLIAGVLMIYAFAGTFSFTALGENMGWARQLAGLGMLLPAAFLLFLGPMGKSAQFPLHEWLPDAMAGPTPVSALIHAATMVKAGVFLIARVGPIFYTALLTVGGGLPVFFEGVAWIGAFTAFLAATQAIVSKEVKKVLAYSTVSQIGYMMLGLGVAGLTAEFAMGYSAGMFHLASHAIFKACMFMAAGSILHACHSRFLDDMGGLRSDMRMTFIAMVIGGASLSGIPPLSGFWSKDAVLEAVLGSGHVYLFVLGVLTAALTVFYTFRMIAKIFYGEKPASLKRLEAEGKHVHEAPPIMWVPYTLLAGATVAIGLVGPFFGEALQRFLLGSERVGAQTVPHVGAQGFDLFLTVALSMGALALGGALCYYAYFARKIDTVKVVRDSAAVKALYRFLWSRWYMNPAYYKGFVSGLMGSGRALWTGFELNIFDRMNFGFAGGGVGVSRAFGWVDTDLVDGFVNWVGTAGSSASDFLRRIQTGIVQQYVFVFVLGIVLLAVYYALR